jgi:adenosylcobinamide-GDP ribazoletransferase
MRSWQEFLAALIFLTRAPIRMPGGWSADLDHRSLVWFPLVGAMIGAMGGALYALAFYLTNNATVAAILAIAGLALLTGALHEDGLTDMADGFGGGQDKQRKLSIMKDSRIGAYGATALILSLALRVALISDIAHPRWAALALIGAHALSRGVLPWLILSLPDARGAPSRHAPPPGQSGAARGSIALLIGYSLLIACLGRLPFDGVSIRLLILCAPILPLLLLIRLARRQIGGITGDVLGAAQQIVELTALLAIAAAL